MIKDEHERNSIFVSEVSTLKLRTSLSLSNDCEPGPRSSKSYFYVVKCSNPALRVCKVYFFFIK